MFHTYTTSGEEKAANIRIFFIHMGMKIRKGPLQPRPARAATGTQRGVSWEDKLAEPLRMPGFFFCAYFMHIFPDFFKITGIFLTKLERFPLRVSKTIKRKIQGFRAAVPPAPRSRRMVKVSAMMIH